MGDPAGIGPDVLLQAWKGGNIRSDAVVIGDPEFLARRAKTLDLNVSISDFNSNDSDKLPVFDIGVRVEGVPGKPTENDARGTIAAIDTAIDMIFAGKTSALVTCPINKDVLYKTGFAHPGHTEYLGELAKRHTGKTSMPVMMLAGPELRTVPVTIHIPLSDVPSVLTSELIEETVRIVNFDMISKFGIAKPRLVLAGLNPHAGENGSIGREEIEVVQSAVERLKASGIDAVGPLPADTMFHPAARERYDAAICMYHDQALIPAKMLGFDDAVNVTLGLPFIRTSPDHGTAYDIAGTGKANPSSFIAALNMAAEMAAKS